MNTIRSTWYGWGTLCVAGGGAYYFAKQQINADRASRYSKERQKQERLQRLEASAPFLEAAATKPKKKKMAPDDHANGSSSTKGLDAAGIPSAEAGDDVAPVGHAPESSEGRIRQKSKYEAAEPYRSKKGDRFS